MFFGHKKLESGGPVNGGFLLQGTSRVMLGVSLVFFLVVLSVASWSLWSLNTERNELAEVSTDARREMEQESDKKNVEEMIKESNEKVNTLRALFVGSADMIPLVEKIESIGHSIPVKLSISSINLSTAKDSAAVRISATGGFSNLYKLVRLLEILPYKIVVDDVDLSRGANDDGSTFSTGKEKKEGVEEKWSANISLTVLSISNDKK
jgi:hypothetical protein